MNAVLRGRRTRFYAEERGLGYGYTDDTDEGKMTVDVLAVRNADRI